MPGASGITSALKHVCAVFPVIYQGQNTHTPLLKRFAWGGLQDSRVLDRVNSLGNTHSLLVPSRCWSPVLPCSRRLPFFFFCFPSRFHSRWCCFITTGHSCCLFIRYLHGSALYGNRVSCWSACGGVQVDWSRPWVTGFMWTWSCQTEAIKIRAPLAGTGDLRSRRNLSLSRGGPAGGPPSHGAG